MAATGGRILIVDDNEELLFALQLYLAPYFKHIDILKSPKTLLNQLEREDYDLVLLDMNFASGINNGNEGLYWLKRILEVDAMACVVLITAYGEVELAVRAIKEGATDFIQKSWDEEKILATLQAAYRQRKSKQEIKSLKVKQHHLSNQIHAKHAFVVGSSPAMKKVMDTVAKVAPTEANVLIVGENGTGKEVIASAIHNLSNRHNQVLINIDLGSLSETLFESELFGAKKGAYTDAKEDRVGRMELASGGTLFMDEIGNIPLHLQSKLLGALQNREITPLGAQRSTPIDIRLISATNKNLETLIKEGLFREDLLYRINTITIELPPLRERLEDIPLLAQFFLERYCNHYQKDKMVLHPSAIKKLESHSWPGNIRELQHVIEKSVIMAASAKLSDEDILITGNKTAGLTNPSSFSLAEHERMLISKAVEACHGNISKAAEKLGINRSTLYEKMKKYGI